MSRLELAVIAAIIVGGAVLLEERHRLVIEPSTHVENTSPARAAGCPDSENEPYSASCLVFMGIVSSMGSQARAADGARAARAGPPRDSEFHSRASSSPCPDTDNIPYSQSCLRFLSGRYWQADPSGVPVPSPVTPK